MTYVRPTHCPQGHEYTAENTRINARGSQVCRVCARAAFHRRPKKRPTERRQWPQERIDQMCDLLAEGGSILGISRIMGLTEKQVRGQFTRICAKLGPQAA